MMKKLVMMFAVLMVVLVSCEEQFVEYDENNKPSVSTSRKLIEKTLKQVAYDSGSVKIHNVTEGKYSKEATEYGQETGWVMQCDFSWTGLRNVPERRRLWFAIKNNLIVTMLEDQEGAGNFYYNIKE
jgi:hypothetical protein